MNTLSLPTQSDMDIFLAELFTQRPTDTFYLARLTQEAKDFFSVTNDDASLPCEAAHGCTSPEATRLEQLAHWGCVHLLHHHTIKRTAPNEYQLKGTDLLGEATAFFKHARNIGFTLEETKAMLWYGRWDDKTIAEAATIAFS